MPRIPPPSMVTENKEALGELYVNKMFKKNERERKGHRTLTSKYVSRQSFDSHILIPHPGGGS